MFYVNTTYMHAYAGHKIFQKMIKNFEMTEKIENFNSIIRFLVFSSPSQVCTPNSKMHRNNGLHKRFELKTKTFV